ncbi:MAG: glycosyltransferase [Alphaproteobacteria bacterium]
MGARRGRVLLAWELGDGLGHVGRLMPLAARLEREGHDPVLAVRDPAQALRVEGARRLPVLQAPYAVPRGARGAGFHARSFADILSVIGYEDEERLRAMLRAWRDLARLVRPVLAIGDFSPTLALALRGTGVPVMLVGSGFALPPAQEGFFPEVNAEGHAIADRERLASSMRRACGAPADATPASLLAGDWQGACTWPLLDPYRDCRAEPAIGPLDPPRVAGRAPDARGWFAYLSAEAPMAPAAIAALEAMPVPGGVFLRDGSAAQRARLAAAGHEVHVRPPDLAGGLRRARLAIHHGGIGTAETALAIGVPQLVLPRHLEQRLTGEALRAAGIGAVVRRAEVARDLAPRALAMMADGRLAARALEVARELPRGGDPCARAMAAARSLAASRVPVASP